jgi:AraC-like DNA-binding protein
MRRRARNHADSWQARRKVYSWRRCRGVGQICKAPAPAISIETHPSSDAGLPLRNWTPPAKSLSAIPSCAGLMTRLACARAKATGIDLPPLLQRVRLSVQDIADESIRLNVATQIQSLNVLAEALNDRLLGFHLGQDMDLRRTGFLYYAAASSDLLGHALQGLARCATTLNEGVRLEADLGETLRAGFAYAGVSRRSDRHQIEAWITAIVRCCRQITGRDLAPLGVRIMHQRTPESAKIDSFLGCTAEFGADRDEIWFAGEAAKLPVVNADRYLNKLVIGYCEEVVSRRKARSGVIQADVENAIAALLPHGETRIENVAQKLRVSPRTLRRKLAAEGVTFAGILEDLRFALAKHYLAEQDLSISRIAWLLGYTEVSAFSHAFRRWTGRTPRADRSRRRRPAEPAAGRRVRGQHAR